MTEPTMQVPVALIEEAADIAHMGGYDALRDRLRALLSQPTPTADERDV